ncbi:SCO6880 family protein [Cellulomonas fimi]|uniref:Uncharacterized protein n=1 Tax=Cellulomonas fimi TaxID=1708 RepID=A0A7Y0LXJ8_CELFI|nr:SCO6880 family protein [Cellulomonas fimi]NMR19198.1 hypothetical protein [Cellulomonas fimi]
MSTGPAAARFGRLERRGLLLGLSGPQVAVVAAGLAIATGAVYSRGAGGLVVSAAVWLPLLVAGTVSVAGRPVVAWVPLLAEWRARRFLGRTTLVVSTRRVPDARTLTLPGIPGTLMVTAAPTSGAALVLDRRAGTVTAIARVSGSGFLLDDAVTQDRKVAGWGRVLATWCQQSAVVRVQVLQRAVPGGGDPVRRWWAAHDAGAGSWADGVVAALVANVQSSATRQETLISVAVRAPRHLGRGLRPEAAATLELTLGALGEALVGADLHLDAWVRPEALGGVLRRAYAPDAAARAETAPVDLPVRLPGPTGATEEWDRLRTDTAVHAVYWVAQWPRTETDPGFLRPLLLAPGARRTVSLIAEPVPVARALREIRRGKVEHAADAAHRVRVGQVEDEATRAELDDLLRREAELVAGHGDLRFTALITVTVSTAAELAAGCAAMETDAAQSLCEVRRLVGQQGLAHAAGALPLARGAL